MTILSALYSKSKVRALSDRLLEACVTKGYDYRCCVTCRPEGMVNNFETRGSPLTRLLGFRHFTRIVRGCILSRGLIENRSRLDKYNRKEAIYLVTELIYEDLYVLRLTPMVLPCLYYTNHKVPFSLYITHTKASYTPFRGH